MRYEFARLAGESVLAVPVDRVREVAELRRSRQPGGKLVLVP
ncbi:hypothetical protein [Amycolatopsis lexingtonensis]